MRKGKVYLAALVLAGVLSACQAKGGETAALTPTGYSSGEVQRISVYYGGALYLYTANGFDGPLEDGFVKVGEVEKTDNNEYPKEELCGTHLDAGQEVYASPETPSKIYVKYDSGYAAFERQSTEAEPGTAGESAEKGQ